MKKMIMYLSAALVFAGGCAAEATLPANAQAGYADAESADIPITEPTAAPVVEIEAEIPQAEATQAEAPDAEATDEARGGFVFTYQDQPIPLGEEMTRVLARLGAENESYEYPSCAFDGDAKMYVYNGFEIATYIVNPDDPDRLYSITFSDDSVSTAEGVYIGQTYADMTAVYGTAYDEIPGSYTYTKDGAALSFTVEDEQITVITYYVEDIYS